MSATVSTKSSNGVGNKQNSSNAQLNTAASKIVIDSTTMPYTCAECYATVILRKQDLVRCTECGYRVLYKKRISTEPVTFVAR